MIEHWEDMELDEEKRGGDIPDMERRRGGGVQARQRISNLMKKFEEGGEIDLDL